MNLNQVRLAGNLTRDTELTFTPKGMAIAKLALAVNRRWKDKQTQEYKEEVTFVDITAFGKSAEKLGQQGKKGVNLYVEGRLRLESWEDKQTHQQRTKLTVVGESFQFTQPMPKSALGAKQEAKAPTPEAAPDSGEPPPGDDDVPF